MVWVKFHMQKPAETSLQYCAVLLTYPVFVFCCRSDVQIKLYFTEDDIEIRDILVYCAYD